MAGAKSAIYFDYLLYLLWFKNQMHFYRSAHGHLFQSVPVILLFLTSNPACESLTRMKRGTPRMLHIMVVFQFWLFLSFLHYLYFSKFHLPWVFQAFQSSFPSLTAHHISVFSVSVIYIRSLEWLWWVSLPSLADRHIIYSDWTWNIFSWPPKICFSDVLKQSWYLCIY